MTRGGWSLLAVLVAWGAAAHAGPPPARAQEPDWLFCGRVLALTCPDRAAGAGLLLESAGSGRVFDLSVVAMLRADLVARLGERYERYVVCVARTAAPAAPGLSRRQAVVRTLDQLTFRLDPIHGPRGDLFTTCDPLVQPPVVVHESKPEYPVDAMRKHVEGVVTLYGVVETDGRVSDVRVVRSVREDLDEEVQRAFSQWRFRPARRLGKAVAVAVTAELTFTVARR